MPSPSSASVASWRSTRRPRERWYQARDRSTSATVRWTAPRRSVAGSRTSDARPGGVSSEVMPTGCPPRAPPGMEELGGCMEVLGRRRLRVGGDRSATAHLLAVGHRRLAVAALERAREVELVAEAGAERDLPHAEVGEPQQARRLEHPALRDELLRRAARHV